MNRHALLVSIAFCFVPWSLCWGGVSKDVLKETVERFNESDRAVRSDHPLLPVHYLEKGRASYSYYLPRRFLRIAKEGDRFRIDDVSYKNRHVRLRFVSSRGAKVALTVYDDQRLTQIFVDEIVPAVLSDIFEFGEPDSTPWFVGNAASRNVHLRACNHLPSLSERLAFATIADAEGAGYRRCVVCFSEDATLPIEGYGPLRVEALEQARLQEVAFPPVVDPDVQARMQAIGDAILDRFPVEPRGFDYAFKALHSEVPHALSYPTGFVYVTDKFLAAVEDPAELQFIIAHEIAHCEFQRTIGEPQGGSPEKWLDELTSYYGQLQFQEVEADIIAILCVAALDDRPDVVRRARNALGKLAFSLESVPSDTRDPFATHPSLSSRLDRFADGRFAVVDSGSTFCGLDENDAVIARARLVATSGADRSSSLYFIIEATDLLNEPFLIPAGPHLDENGAQTRGTSRAGLGCGYIAAEAGNRISLFNRQTAYRIQPGEAAVIELGSAGALDVDAVTEFSLSGFKTVKRWTVCP